MKKGQNQRDSGSEKNRSIAASTLLVRIPTFRLPSSLNQTPMIPANPLRELNINQHIGT